MTSHFIFSLRNSNTEMMYVRILQKHTFNIMSQRICDYQIFMSTCLRKKNKWLPYVFTTSSVLQTRAFLNLIYI